MKKVLVAGDFFLDSYTIGRASRLSPEAPVPIVLAEKEEYRAGGAGNVCLNLIAQEVPVKALGRIGGDEKGNILIQELEKQGVDTSYLLKVEGYTTALKHRVIANFQQIVRVDYETVVPFLQEIPHIADMLEDVGVVAISDYGKGFLSRPLLRRLIDEAKRRAIPVIADPKGRDFSLYAGAEVIKPNEGEAYEAAYFSRETPLEEVASRLFAKVEMQVLMVTRSDKGISLFFPEGIRQDFPVAVHQVRDVTGAGDTVLATLAAGFLRGIPLEEAVHRCNAAASIAIERLGCVSVTREEIEERMGKKGLV